MLPFLINRLTCYLIKKKKLYCSKLLVSSPFPYNLSFSLSLSGVSGILKHLDAYLLLELVSHCTQVFISVVFSSNRASRASVVWFCATVSAEVSNTAGISNLTEYRVSQIFDNAISSFYFCFLFVSQILF